MRVLYFAPHQQWPLTTGARLRDYYLARELAHGGFDVTFVETLHPGDDPRAVPANGSFSRVVSLRKDKSYTPGKLVRGILGPLPVTVLNLYSKEMEAGVSRVLQEGNFDAVQLEGPPLSAYVDVIRRAPSRPAILADWHNIESELMARYAEAARSLKKLVAWRTAHLLERTENQLLTQCEVHTVPSERERQVLLARVPGANIHVIPNGVDTASHCPEAMMAGEGNRNGAGQSTILFVGSMDYHANIDAVVWFAREVWPAAAAANPALKFVIAGRNPAPAVQALAGPRIEVTGTVEDVRPYYGRALAVVAPLRVGSGTRLKILEAMAACVPVVSTTLGAEGIEAEDGVHLLIADGAGQMAAAVTRLAQSAELRSQLSKSGRELVASCYDWPAIGRQLCGIYGRLIESRRARS